MAVRRELVIDECGGAKRRRRQAHAFYLLNLINCQINTIILTTNNRTASHSFGKKTAKRRGDEAAFCADPLAKPLPYLSPRAVFRGVEFFCLRISLFREA